MHSTRTAHAIATPVTHFGDLPGKRAGWGAPLKIEGREGWVGPPACTLRPYLRGGRLRRRWHTLDLEAIHARGQIDLEPWTRCHVFAA